MPAPKIQTKRIPLAGNPNRRTNSGTSAQDQLFTNCIITPHAKVGGDPTIYVEKRPGLSLSTTPLAAKGSYIYYGRDGSVYPIYANGNIYSGGDYIGTIQGASTVGYVTEGVVDASLQNMIIFSSTNHVVGQEGGIYLFNTSYDPETTAFLANTSTGSPTLSNCAGGAWADQEVAVGQALSGTGIPANARVKAVDYGANTITMGTDDATEVNATATNNGITVTREHIQKLMSANIPATTKPFYAHYMDGYIFFITDTGKLYNTQYNDYHTVLVSNYLSVSRRGGQPSGMAIAKNKLMVATDNEINFYQNVGNPQGSVLKRIPEAVISMAQARSQTGTMFQFRNYVAIAMGFDVYLYDTDTGKMEEITSLHSRHESYVAAGGSQPTVRIVRQWSKTYVTVVYASATSHQTTMAYDIETKAWTKWNFGKTMLGASSPVQDRTAWISTNDATGSVYLWTDRLTMVWQDNAVSYTMTIQLARNDFGTQRYKRINRLTLIGDEQASAASVSISWSDDDYQNFNTARTVDMSDNRGTITELGVMRRPAFKLENSSNTPLRLEAIEIEYEELAR